MQLSRFFGPIASLSAAVLLLLMTLAAGAQPSAPDRSSRVVAAANTTGVLVLPTKGVLTGFVLYNTSAAKSFVKLYDKASAPTVGTDTPFLTIGLPIGGNVNLSGLRKRLDAGLGWGITTAIADADTTAPSAGDVTGMLLFREN